MRIFVATFAAATLAALSASPAQAQMRGYGMANPASTYCAQLGGRSVNRYDSDGGARGYCHLRDGREVDEWQLYRERGRTADRRGYNDDRRGWGGYDDRANGYGAAASSYCTRSGGRYYTARPTTGGAMRGWCRTRDGRTWDAQQLFDQYGNRGSWSDRTDGDQDYSYQQQYRSWDDRSSEQYDSRDDDDRDYRSNDDRDDQLNDDDRAY